jgi:hypothetical protein
VMRAASAYDGCCMPPHALCEASDDLAWG